MKLTSAFRLEYPIVYDTIRLLMNYPKKNNDEIYFFVYISITKNM